MQEEDSNQHNTPQTDHCVSCGAPMPGNYCAVCGEQRLTPKLRSLSFVALDVLEAFTSLDGKVGRTVRALVVSPGRLERDYHEGRRVGYLKPITLFFIVNILFITFSPLNDFYVAFYDQLTGQAYSDFSTPLVTEYVKTTGLSLDEFGRYYDQLVGVIARSLIIMEVPFFALLAGLVLRHESFYASDYFTYSLNLHSWLLSWMLIGIPIALVVSFPLGWFGQSVSVDQVYLLLFPVGIAGYCALATRHMFRLSWLGVFLRLPLLMMALVISHLAYRLVQLVITVALVST